MFCEFGAIHVYLLQLHHDKYMSPVLEEITTHVIHLYICGYVTVKRLVSCKDLLVDSRCVIKEEALQEPAVDKQKGYVHV